jgi:hypothetical protein
MALSFKTRLADGSLFRSEGASDSEALYTPVFFAGACASLRSRALSRSRTV